MIKKILSEPWSHREHWIFVNETKKSSVVSFFSNVSRVSAVIILNGGFDDCSGQRCLEKISGDMGA